MASFGEGDAVKDLLWVIGLIIVLGVLWFVLGGPAKFALNDLMATSSATSSIPNIVPDDVAGRPRTGLRTRPGSSPAEDEEISPVDLTASAYSGQVYLRLGRSGEETNDLDEEYVEITADRDNDTPINITGWTINNGKGEKTYPSGSKLVKGVATIVKIPRGTTMLTGKGNSDLSSIYLEPGERAFVVSGRVPIQTEYKVDASFKSNKCFGYLVEYPHYRFTPVTNVRCPSYDQEVDVDSIPDICESIVRRFGSSCLTPKISYDRDGNKLLNGYETPKICQNLIIPNFGYATCFARHSKDKDFLKDRWYVYLNQRGFPLYASRNVTITLYDSLGKVVDRYSY